MPSSHEKMDPAELKGVKFLVELQQTYHLTGSAVPVVTSFIDNILLAVEAKFERKLSGCGQRKELIMEIFRAAVLEEKPFKKVKTQYTLLAALRQHCNMVLPIEVPFPELAYRENKTAGKCNISEKNLYAQVVPLKSSLTQLLNIDEILNFVLNPDQQSDSEFIASVKDGLWYNTNDICKKYKNPLVLSLYEDDVDFVNPLGSYTKVHKEMISYFSLLNIPQHLQSNLKSISLVSIAKASYVKDYGFEPCFKDFIDTVKELESDAGLSLVINGEPMIFHGTLLFVVGDSLALNVLGGFKDGIGGASKPCRVCLVGKSEFKSYLLEDFSKFRDKVSHEKQLAEVLNPSATQTECDKLSVLYGISNDSLLRTELVNFDITKCLCMDLMHNFFEGGAEIDTKAILNQFIEIDQLLTYDTLNRLIKSFPYPDQMKKNIPSVIERKHVIGGALRQSASQMACLIVILPFVLAPFVEVGNKFLAHFVLLNQIGNTLMAYRVKKISIPMIKHLIFVHHKDFLALYPDAPFTPKFHFLTHAANTIQLFGPSRATSAMRYEARHCKLKNIARQNNNYKNLEKTLATQFQINRSKDLNFGDSKSVVLSCNNFNFSKTSLVPLASLPFRDFVSKSLHCQGPLVTAAQTVWLKNFELAQGTLLIFEDDDDELPVFCQVASLFVNENKCAMVVNIFETKSFDEMRNAYVLMCTTQHIACDPLALPSLQSIPFIVYGNVNYAVLTNYDRNEFVGSSK